MTRRPLDPRQHGHAVAFWGITRRELRTAGLEDGTDLAADIALKLTNIIGKHTMVGWQNDRDIQNRIRNAADDFFDEVRDRRGLVLSRRGDGRDPRRRARVGAGADGKMNQPSGLCAEWKQAHPVRATSDARRRSGISVAPDGSVSVLAPEHATDEQIIARVTRGAADGIVRRFRTSSSAGDGAPRRGVIRGETTTFSSVVIICCNNNPPRAEYLCYGTDKTFTFLDQPDQAERWRSSLESLLPARGRCFRWA